jgi:ketosteroid isomerase-like protein
MKRFSSTLVIVVLASCAAESPSVDAEAEAAELMRISREWSDVAGSGDLDATLAYWADDAVMMPPGMPPLKGKQAIREFIEASASMPGSAIRWEPLEAHVSPSGDFAYLLERNEVSFEDSTGVRVTEWNKVVTVWRKQSDGSWKNVIDIWNADPTAWR